MLIDSAVKICKLSYSQVVLEDTLLRRKRWSDLFIMFMT